MKEGSESPPVLYNFILDRYTSYFQTNPKNKKLYCDNPFFMMFVENNDIQNITSMIDNSYQISENDLQKALQLAEEHQFTEITQILSPRLKKLCNSCCS